MIIGAIEENKEMELKVSVNNQREYKFEKIDKFVYLTIVID